MTSEIPHILVVDDHENIRDPLSKYLKQNGMRVSTASCGAQAYQVMEKSAIDLVVLDILMPGESGLDVCRRIRETKGIPVILLTAVDDDMDKIVGLEVGADDYVTKPFNPRELLARTRVVLRRANSLPRQFSEFQSGYVSFGDWFLNTDNQTLKKQNSDEEIPLSTTEFRLLTTFLRHPKIVLSRDQLLDIVSSRSGDIFDRSIDNQVSRLRKKIEDDPKNPKIIKTVWASGYMFTADVVKT